MSKSTLKNNMKVNQQVNKSTIDKVKQLIELKVEADKKKKEFHK